MYVDESGVPEIKDNTKFFVASGAVFHEKELETMKKLIIEFKNNNFTGKLDGAELHVHDIYKGKNVFYGLSKQQKYDLLDNVYSTIEKLDLTIITIAIDKTKLKIKYPHYKIAETAYKFLIERFDKFLGEKDNKGVIRIDRTTNDQEIKLNKRDCDILQIVNAIRKYGTGWQTISHIVEEPLFYNSSMRKGLQVADAIAYCTNRHLAGYSDFEPYWNVIQSKLRCNELGKTDGYGFRIFPYK